MNKKSETRNFIALNGEERRTIAVLYGFRSLYATDIENYELYKKNRNEYEIPEDNLAEMKVLDTLSELGFPMECYGTYFYKDVIMATKPSLDRIIKCGHIEEYENLKALVEKPINSFYLDISRNQNEMPVMDFHNEIMYAIESIDASKINMETVYQIFGENSDINSYGEAAIKIGLYSFGMRSHDVKTSEYEEFMCYQKAPKIKQITGLNK